MFSKPFKVGTTLFAITIALLIGNAEVPGRAEAATFVHVVNSTAEDGDADVTDGLCDTAHDPDADPPVAASGICTLRAAVQSVFRVSGTHIIRFEVPVVGPPEFSDTSVPGITVIIEGPVTIDLSVPGTGFPNRHGIWLHAGYSGIQIKGVWIKGTGSVQDGYPLDTEGIKLISNFEPQVDCLIEGSHVTGFETPIFLHSQYAGCTIKDTVFGIDPDGNPIGNKNGVLLIGDGFSVIGSTISATQSRNALDVRGDEAVVKGNRFGTSPTGKELVGNPGGGVLVQGDRAKISRNVVAGSPFAGLAVFGNDNEFYRNRIGTDVRGVKEDFGNGGIGLIVDGNNNCIGTLRKHAAGQCRMNDKTADPKDFSVVSGNLGHGISIAGDGNVLLAHTIGTDVNHTTATRNAGHGVSMEFGAVNTLITDNVISGNRASGLFLRLADETVVRANQIGTDITGTVEVPNTEHGILIETGLDNIIGGTEDGDGNIIAFNDGDGIRALTNLTVENAFLGNSIFGNGELGIDLGGNGVTPNDYLDLDHKPPNRGQNYPKVRSTPDQDTGRTTVAITLSSAPSTTYRVEVFANDEPDESGYGEGQYYLGSTDLTTDEDGEVSATVSFPGLHSNVSATATDPDGNTSEYSSIRGLIVNSTSDGTDEDPGNGTCDTGNVVDREGTQEPECTLRAAVQETNSKASPGQIDFDIPQPGTPIIALDSALPVVTSPLLLDATTQPSGEVEVTGTSIASGGPGAGPSASATGLEFSAGPVMIKGVAIKGFSGNGVQANRGVVLTLQGVEIADNCGWGVRVKRRLTVLGSTEDPTRISGNGTAQGCLGGDVLAFGVGRVSVSDAEIVSNGGPGILTRGDVDLRRARVNNNKGDGVRSQGDAGGSISILEGADNQINGNMGDGLSADLGVTIKDSSVDINANGSWGIRVADENVLINAGVTELGSGTAIRINNNGKGATCHVWSVDQAGKVEHEEGNCEGGGILRMTETDDSDTVQNAEIIGNGGPGILTVGDITLGVVKINDNRGDGVKSAILGASGGSVSIFHGEDDQIRGNQGHGIFAEEGIIVRDSVLDISGNAGWGINVTGENVVINHVVDRKGDPDASRTLVNVSGNGNGPICHVWSVDQLDDVTKDEEPCSGGGIRRIRENDDLADRVQNAHVIGNNGAGIFTQADVRLEFVKVNDNDGPGIHGAAEVTIRRGEVCRNAGHGIVAGSTPEIRQVEICDNSGSGLVIEDDTSTAPEFSSTGVGTSSVFGNLIGGNGGDGVRIASDFAITLNRNNLVDNAGFGINNLAPTAALDATGNWWGDPDGPGGQGPGAGDGVNGNVDFTGWTPKIIALAVLASPDSVEVPGGNSVQVRLYLQSWDQPNDVVHVDVSDPLGWLEGPGSFDVVLDSGDATVIAQFTVPVGTPGGITNDVTITGVSQSDPDQTGDATVAITSAPSADLAVSKEDDADPVILGSQVTYSITVSNSGPDQATGVILLDTLPDTVEFVSSSNGSANCSADSGLVICQLAQISSGGQSKVDIVVTTLETGEIVNHVTVTANEHDPNTGDNSDTEATSVQRLAGDEFPGSVIENLPFDATVNTSTAGLDPGEPEPSCAGIGATLWYAYTPSATATLQANTFGSDFDTVLAVYEGEEIGSLTEVDCNDDTDGSQSEMSFSAAPGTTYYFQVGGWQGETGELRFHLEGIEPPPNDWFPGGVISTLPFGGVLDSSRATLEPGEPEPTCGSNVGATTWYRYTPPADTILTADTRDSDFDTVLTVYTGAELSSLIEVECNDDADDRQSEVVFSAQQGVTYYFQAAGYDAEFGNLHFHLEGDLPEFQCRGVTATIVGTPVQDTLIGSSGDDVIVALDGDDVINASGGNDLVCAGPGHDTVDAGGGKDRVYGDQGRDDLRGGTGNDRLFGGAGKDVLNGHRGNDRLIGNGGNDQLIGSGGKDTLKGGGGNDDLKGGGGNNTMNCGPGTDTGNGGPGTDSAVGCETTTGVP